MSVLIKVSAIWPLLKREVHQENLINYGKTTGRYVTISNSQSARRALWASSPQPIWAVAAGNRILRQRCWHKKSRKCISLQDHVNLYQDIKVLTSYCSIIGKPISGQDIWFSCVAVQTVLSIATQQQNLSTDLFTWSKTISQVFASCHRNTVRFFCVAAQQLFQTPGFRRRIPTSATKRLTMI